MNKRIQFGSTEIVELADNSQDFKNESKLSLTMSVDDFERRRFMRLERQESEIEFFFFLDRMASTVPPHRPLMAPQRQMSRENIFDGKEEKNQPLKMPEERPALFDASHAVSSIFLVVHAVSKFLSIARKSTAAQEPVQGPVQEPVQDQPLKMPERRAFMARKPTVVHEPGQ
jgi:hypothetical protein